MRRKLWQTLSSIKTGVVLLIVVVIFSAAGTLILQRPMTENDDMQRAYSPGALRFLDAVGLTDVFHTWWFLTLLVLVSASIIAASIDRFPNSWRFVARPYRVPEPTFRRMLENQREFAIASPEAGLALAERAFSKIGLKPERVKNESGVSLFAQRNVASNFAVYIVHASLLLIFVGGIVDAIYGWRGSMQLTQGQTSATIEQRDGKVRNLGFALRCESAGQQNYADGTPKRWWSKLTVLEQGREVANKEIAVNDPLVYRGVRFYQSSYGHTGTVEKLVLGAIPLGNGEAKEIALAPGQAAAIDSDTTVRLAEFIPDYVVRDGQIYTRSEQVQNPAVHLVVESKSSGRKVNYWMPDIQGFAENGSSPYNFEARNLEMAYFTGLQVSHEPGQWAVWAGVLLMGLGLAAVFYLVHQRFWAMATFTRRGDCVLWVGGAANKNKDAFEERFRALVAEVETELKLQPKAREDSREELMVRA
ncbi:MAG TPA: cytochrome c biogenesis protein ResB [Terriglobales bacterium]|nr:cytochrome c biogenesis protein ResB [Terriglobales bacterium]